MPTHSKLFEKIVLERVKIWAEGAQIVSAEQSGFRPGGLLGTRVLSISQEVKTSLAANMPALAVYIDFKKAYDIVWHAGLMVKLYRLGMPLNLLKITLSWLKDRQAYIVFGERRSENFQIDVGLPQGSSLSPYLFIVYHSDLINCAGAHSKHIYADDLSILVKALITKYLSPTIESLGKEGSKVCNRRAAYAKKWKQPINVQKTVGQVFCTQLERPKIKVYMQDHKVEIAEAFKSLGFTWTSKLSLRPTVDQSLKKIEKTLAKLRRLNKGGKVSVQALKAMPICIRLSAHSVVILLLPLPPQDTTGGFGQKI